MSGTAPGVASAGAPLRLLPLAAEHARLGARFAPFAGWEMPVQYTGIVAEHEAVRAAAGIFDVSHMGRFWLSGPEAGAALRSVVSADVTALAVGQARYALACTEAGGIADDVFIYRVGAERWLVVHNAANAALGAARLAAACNGRAAEVVDVTAETVMFAVQGPAALAHARALLGEAVGELPPRHAATVELDGAALDGAEMHGATVTVCRTGYTGEDGVEVIAGPEAGRALWRRWVAAGVPPCGLGARDTLRLEAALPLHGADITAETTPYEAGLGWAVELADRADFTGRAALVALAEGAPRRRLRCIRLDGRGVPRAGYAVYRAAPGRGADGGAAATADAVGEPPLAALTSGAYGPTLKAGIAMAYLPAPDADPGTPLLMDLRGRLVPATVVTRPFYRGTR